MLTKWLFAIALGFSALLFADNLSDIERVQIYSINGRSVPVHPQVINVLPGEQLPLKADVYRYGNSCGHDEGCPEGLDLNTFLWSADDRAGDECNSRYPEACRNNGSFEPQGNTVIFHIPASMDNDIQLRVVHEGLTGSDDTLVLHNGRQPEMVQQTIQQEEPPRWGGYWDDYGYQASSSPYYAYPIYPYPYYAWGWGFGWSVAWWHPLWTYGYFHPGIYEYYRPEWWAHGGYIARAEPLTGPHPAMVRGPMRPGYYGGYRGTSTFSGRGWRRRWR